MITSLLITGRYNIELTGNKIDINDNKINLKDIPFIRYRFNDEYTEDDIKYISRIKKVFTDSCHLVELNLSANNLNFVDTCMDAIKNVIIYLYVRITDEEVKNGLSDEVSLLLKDQRVRKVERIMVKDESDSLYSISVINIKKEIGRITGIKSDDIGICGSPLSNGRETCLDALRARELISRYGEEGKKAATISLNTQDMSHCSCSRYMEVNKDIFGKAQQIGKKSNGSRNLKSKEEKRITGQIKSNKKLPTLWD